MGEIRYAYVIYEDNKQFSTVPISDVKVKKNSENHITPTSDTDYEKRKLYYVKWSDCDGDCREDHLHYGYYPAFILLLGESVQDIDNKVAEGRRLIIPRGVPSSESEETVILPRNQKHPAPLQDVQKKKNVDILNKHRSKALLSSRKRFTAGSDDEDENQKENDAECNDTDIQDEEDNGDVTENRVVTIVSGQLKQRLQDKNAEIVKSEKMLHEFENQNRSSHPTVASRNIKIKEERNVRRNLFSRDDNETVCLNRVLPEHHDDVSNDISHNGGGVKGSASAEFCSKTKPSITHIQKIQLHLNDVSTPHQTAGNQNESEQTIHPTFYGSRRIGKGDINDRNFNDENSKRNMKKIAQPKSTSLGIEDPSISEKDLAECGSSKFPNNERNEDVHNHNDGVAESASDDDSTDENERGVRRLPLRAKRRRIEPIGVGRKNKIPMEIEAALRYYENHEVDGIGRKLYDVTGNKIYLGEGVEVSATLWFMFQQNKPSLFFGNMIELIWSRQKLLNRCLNKKQVTTQLLERSPRKELTPEKKRLTYKLYSDYLDAKKVQHSEKMKFLSKVPAMYTAKINNLRKKYYH